MFNNGFTNTNSILRGFYAFLFLVTLYLINPLQTTIIFSYEQNNECKSISNFECIISKQWSGYGIILSEDTSHKNYINLTQAQWKIPKIYCKSTNNTSSSIWIGLGGILKNDETLIQLGSDQDCINGIQNNRLWMEINSVGPIDQVILPIEVHINDIICATINYNYNLNKYILYIVNQNTSKSVIKEYDDIKGPSLTVEWILEDTYNLGTNNVYSISNFTNVNFNKILYKINPAYTNQTNNNTVINKFIIVNGNTTIKPSKLMEIGPYLQFSITKK